MSLQIEMQISTLEGAFLCVCFYKTYRIYIFISTEYLIMKCFPFEIVIDQFEHRNHSRLYPLLDETF
jgi:hypothetical protein